MRMGFGSNAVNGVKNIWEACDPRHEWRGDGVVHFLRGFSKSDESLAQPFKVGIERFPKLPRALMPLLSRIDNALKGVGDYLGALIPRHEWRGYKASSLVQLLRVRINKFNETWRAFTSLRRTNQITDFA
jgi:hypothetical protein